MKNVNNFQVVKVQPQGVASICLIFFCQFQPDVAYENVACEKNVCIPPFINLRYNLVEKYSNRTEKKQQKTNIFITVMKNTFFAAMLALENELTYF